jgi:hypothetical protein
MARVGDFVAASSSMSVTVTASFFDRQSSNNCMDLWVKNSMQDDDDNNIELVRIAKAVVGGGGGSRRGNEVLVSSHSVVVVVVMVHGLISRCVWLR